MPLHGSIETFYLSSLFQLISNDKKTGILKISRPDYKAEIYFKEGTIVNATASDKEIRLGYLLRSEGVISKEVLNSCLHAAREKEQKIGKVLVESGHISEQELEKFIYQQAEQILYSLFLWEKGEFEYKDTALIFEDQLVIPMDTMGIILEASRRVDEISVLTKTVPEENHILILSDKHQETDTINLNEDEKSILSLINEKRTVKQVVYKSGYDEYCVYKALFSLMSSGIVNKGKKLNIDKTILETLTASDKKQLPDTGNKTNSAEIKKAGNITFWRRPLIITALAGTVVIFIVISFWIQYWKKHLPLEPMEHESTKTIQKSNLIEKTKIKLSSKKKDIPLPVEKKETAAGKIEKPSPELDTKPAKIISNEPSDKFRVFQYSNDFFSLNLPEGYTVVDKSDINKTHISFKYPPNINITVATKKSGYKWNPEIEMYKNIMDIKEGGIGFSDLTIDHYGIVEFAGNKGYEILLTGMQKNTAAKVKLYVLKSDAKLVFMDIVCLNWRTEKVNKLFNQINKSVKKTFRLF